MNEIEFEEIEVLNLKIFLIALSILIVGFIIFTNIFSYQKYYHNVGIIYKEANEFYLKMFVNIEDIEEILDSNTINIDGEYYNYRVYYIKKDLYVNEDYKNYQEVLLKTTIKYPIENRTVNISIKTKKEKIIKFIFNCIKGGTQ